ncbi:hypothetical protein HTS88_21020 [Pseudarthrobacter oxydans]|uniref:hypothetical protein n=1 Tax=Pseudarthrobacter oxydans TaxID=1671 RepID=UPI0015740569|nr:hypothetical protein [Pseudarthrobacter oxydans]NSX38864.1 hypothetical protein [Pseudarthrobacter oxydans]
MFEFAAAMLLAGGGVAALAVLIAVLLVGLAFAVEGQSASPAAHIPSTGISDREGHIPS